MGHLHGVPHPVHPVQRIPDRRTDDRHGLLRQGDHLQPDQQAHARARLPDPDPSRLHVSRRRRQGLLLHRGRLRLRQRESQAVLQGRLLHRTLNQFTTSRPQMTTPDPFWDRLLGTNVPTVDAVEPIVAEPEIIPPLGEEAFWSTRVKLEAPQERRLAEMDDAQLTRLRETGARWSLLRHVTASITT